MTSTLAQKKRAARARRPLTAERLRELVSYDPMTGVMHRKRSISNKTKIGDEIAGVQQDGYLLGSVDGRQYLVHRLAWLYANGAWPNGDIDHINGQRTDNRIENLRDVPRRINQENIRFARSHSKTGLLGVSPKDGRYRARINVHGRAVYIGKFDTAEKAHHAYLEAKRKLHDGCTI